MLEIGRPPAQAAQQPDNVSPVILRRYILASLYAAP